ncbi:hypothetical protein D9M71_798430 [compost metagenome]
MLFQLGYAPVYVPFSGFTKASGVTFKIPGTDALPGLGHPAILQVLTASGLIHQVFFDGKFIHDPSPTVPGLSRLEEYVVVDALFVSNCNLFVRKKPTGDLTAWHLLGR